MKIKELINLLENFNPEKEIEYRNYMCGSGDKGFTDLPIHDVRLTADRKGIVMATQCGVE